MMRSYKNFIRDQIILFPFSSVDYLSLPSISMKGNVLSAKCELMSSENAPLSGCAARREVEKSRYLYSTKSSSEVNSIVYSYHYASYCHADRIFNWLIWLWLYHIIVASAFRPKNYIDVELLFDLRNV